MTFLIVIGIAVAVGYFGIQTLIRLHNLEVDLKEVKELIRDNSRGVE